MAKDETRRLSPSLLQQDKDAFAALKQFDDYAPANKDYTASKLQAAADAADAAQEEETQAAATAAAKRDAATAAEWAFHNAVLSAKDQVRAQYGKDSDEVQSLGLKKESEKARGGRKPAPAPAKT